MTRTTRKPWRRIWILEKQDRGCGLDSSGLGQGSVAGSCEHGNEPSDFMKCWKFLEWLCECWLLNKDSVPWT
jgi:hypothetical protein